MASDDAIWKKMSECAHQGMQVISRRLAGPYENRDAIWTIGAATLGIVDAVNWERSKFLRSMRADSLKSFHDAVGWKYNIGEVELITSVGNVVFRGEIWHGGKACYMVPKTRMCLHGSEIESLKSDWGEGKWPNFMCGAQRLEYECSIATWGDSVTVGRNLLLAKHNWKSGDAQEIRNSADLKFRSFGLNSANAQPAWGGCEVAWRIAPARRANLLSTHCDMWRNGCRVAGSS